MNKTRSPRPHLEIQHSGSHYVGILRTSFRVGNKIRHKQTARLTSFTLRQLKKIRAVMRGMSAILAARKRALGMKQRRTRGQSGKR